MVAGGTYDFGLGANNDPQDGNPKLIVTVQSPGYDDEGNATTITRTLYGTKQVRLAYPNQAENDESVADGNLTVRIALSEYIYSGDTITNVTVLAGLYSDGNVVSGPKAVATRTNNSGAAHQKVVANWSWPGYQRMDASSKLRCVAFHRHGEQGRPVRCVKFSVSDGTTTNEEIVTAPTVDATIGDAVPVVEYITTTDLTAGLTQGAELTLNFTAYPWVGDAGSALDTSTGTAAPTPLYGPIKGLCDRTGAYGVTKVLVDPVGGDNSTGQAYDSGSFDEATAAPCLTIMGALLKAYAYNSTVRSRADVGGVEIHLKEGNYFWTGGTGTLGATPDTWTVFKKAASAARDNVVMSTMSGDSDVTDRVRFEDVKVFGNTNAFFNGVEALWFDNCTLDQTGISNTGWALVYGASTWYVTRSNVVQVYQGLRPYSTQNTPPALVRGNNLNGFEREILSYTVLGNAKTDIASAPPTSLFRFHYSTSQTAPIADNGIVAFNRILGWRANTLISTGQNTTSASHGTAIVQNEFEYVGTTSFAIMALAADGHTGSVNNVLIWNNTLAGQRANVAYNDVGTGFYERTAWSMKNNIFEDLNTKHDTFGTPNANRLGGWPFLYGVGSSGNLSAQISGIGAAGTFLHEFIGVRSYQPTATPGTQPPAGGTNVLGFVDFVDRQAYDGSTQGAGNGDYHLGATSPARNMQRDLLIPYDLDGNARAATDAAGCYAQS